MTRLIAPIACTALALAACDVGQDPQTGIGEPFQVSAGQFILGSLPGSPPPDGGPAAASADAGTSNGAYTGPPSILSILSPSALVVPGVAGKSFGGDVTSNSIAVGVRLADMGTGYWVVPVGPPDVMLANANTYNVSAGFDPNDTPGLHPLRFVALDGAGNAGVQTDLQVCIESRIPDNGHACDPTVAPPSAVFSLQWDTNFDLDLHVVTPAGLDYNAKDNPLGEALEAGVRTVPSDLPFVDRDSLRSCVADGLRQEDLVFPTSLPSGRYHIYVDPFTACGQNQVHFTFTLYKSSGKCPNCNLGVAQKPISGELLASQVTGGTQPPLFVEDVVVE